MKWWRIICIYLLPTCYLLKPPIHDATCSMQPVACYKIASCVLEKLRVTSSVKLLQVNTIMVYSTQHVAWSFKGLTGNADTEHLSRRGDLHMCSGIQR